MDLFKDKPRGTRRIFSEYPENKGVLAENKRTSEMKEIV